MNITIISGSHRKASESGRIARHLAATLRSEGLCEEPGLIDLANNPLPLWEQKIWDGDPEWMERLTPLSKQLAASDGFVVVSPEWHGMVPSGLKNFFLLWGKGELAHKPALLTAVSAGDGGAYPIAELRMSSYKNNRLCYIPEHLIVRNSGTVLHEDAERNDDERDTKLRKRIRYALNLLCEYAKALHQVRDSGAVDHASFKSGM